MKFIHIADVHWGMNPDSDRPWSRERAQAIRDSFAEVVRQARQPNWQKWVMNKVLEISVYKN